MVETVTKVGRKTTKKKEKKYVGHSLPTGCMVVSLDEDEEEGRKHGDWDFHYNGWKSKNPTNRTGAGKFVYSEMFPKNRKGSLDVDVLKSLGLKKKTIEEKDCLFFYQLLLPFCDTQRSGLDNDPRMSYYSEVEAWTNAYALEIGLGGSYGHKFNNVLINELVNFDGILVKDGVKGGSDGAIYRRWQNSEDMDGTIIDAMTYRRFL